MRVPQVARTAGENVSVLTVAYSPLLVMSSILVAIMAAYTTLRLTSGLSDLSIQRRKVRVSQAAVALGGGIWSMHFVGMLAVELPVPIFYNPLQTLMSVLVAVLLTGAALMALHFGVRTRARIVLAGAITGFGIVSMHYIGMSAISGNCVVSYMPIGVIIAVTIAVAASILAMHLAYRTRSLITTMSGAVVLGLSISAMHYSAMLYTTFAVVEGVTVQPTEAISSNSLALIVALSTFLICGIFLLIAVPGGEAERPSDADTASAPTAELPDSRAKTPVLHLSRAGETVVTPIADSALSQVRIPYERDKSLRYLPAQSIHFIQADGHYSRIVNADDSFFCPWSISRLEKSLRSEQFMRTHRSYLVNTRLIKGFRRDGDKGVCIIGADKEAEVPVSRANVAKFQELLSA